MMKKRIDDARVTLNEYIKYHKTKLETMKGSEIEGSEIGGSGIKGRGRKQRGGNVMFSMM